MDSWEKIKSAGDKNPCMQMFNAMYMDEFWSAHDKLNAVCSSIFEEAYKNAIKNDCYKHMAEKYIKVEFSHALAWYSSPCHIIEFHFKGTMKSEDYCVDEVMSQYPVDDSFRMYEYEFVDYLK